MQNKINTENKIAFVILHYLAEKETADCIEAIQRNITWSNKHIIVVDNASTNDSFTNIQNKYGKTVVCLQNKENLGFARGNNIGYKYAKEIIGADFIVMLNNDTVIKQHDFCDVLVQKYKDYNYYVLGPDIITRDGFHQNPMKDKNWTLSKLRIFKLKAIIRLIDAMTIGIIPIIFKNKLVVNGTPETTVGDLKNVRLHGACLIFSSKYIKEYEGLDSGTFLYMEEDLLQMHMKHDKHLMLYSDALSITHKEDAATNLVTKTEKQRRITFLKNLLASINVCIEREKENSL